MNYLQCLSDEGDLTALGRLASQFPLDPMLAVMLIGSPAYSCSEEILTIVAMLSVPNVLCMSSTGKKESRRSQIVFAQADGDHLTLINVYEAFISPEASEIGTHKWCRITFIQIFDFS